MRLQLIRKLDVIAGSRPGRRAWLSAASGLVRIAGEFCVVADDELHVGRFPLDPLRPGRLQRLLPGDLPVDPHQRKQRKPDLEVLLRLPAFAGLPHGALLALGSGSGAHRCRGALLQLSSADGLVGRPRGIEASALFTRLSNSIPDLNLEGGFVTDRQFCLLQRGNKGNAGNALLQWNLDVVLRSLRRERCLPDADPQRVRNFDLGDIQGVPLGFTDAAPLPQGGWLFSAVAENTDNAFADGPCLGSALGRVDARGRLRWVRTVARHCKIEGIDAEQHGRQLRAWLVTDADDPRVPASLLQWDG